MTNVCTIMGRLVRDPELRHTTAGIPVCSFSIANERPVASADGTRETDFVDCVAWRGAAEFAAKYFEKGRMICVTGRFQSRKWQDKQGNNRLSWELVAEHVEFCGDGARKQAELPKTDDFAELEEDDAPFK